MILSATAMRVDLTAHRTICAKAFDKLPDCLLMLDRVLPPELRLAKLGVLVAVMAWPTQRDSAPVVRLFAHTRAAFHANVRSLNASLAKAHCAGKRPHVRKVAL